MSDYVLEDFKNAVSRLEEVMNMEKTAVNRDSAIKRFELCFDLAWKAIKYYAKFQGFGCNSPRQCFKDAFQLKLLDYNEDWLKMIDDRNASVHLYSESYADEVYKKLIGHLELFKKLLAKLKE